MQLGEKLSLSLDDIIRKGTTAKRNSKAKPQKKIRPVTSGGSSAAKAVNQQSPAKQQVRRRQRSAPVVARGRGAPVIDKRLQETTPRRKRSDLPRSATRQRNNLRGGFGGGQASAMEDEGEVPMLLINSPTVVPAASHLQSMKIAVPLHSVPPPLQAQQRARRKRGY